MSFFPGQTVNPFGSDYEHLGIVHGDETHVVERAAMVQIRLNLEQEVQRQESNWAQRDQDFAAAMGLPYLPTTIARVSLQNYFVGARPSLIGSTADFWPSITTRAAMSKASSEQGDQWDIFDVQLDVEVLCKAGPVPQDRLHEQAGIDAEGEVNKQVQRLSAAVHMCVRLDPTLGGVVLPYRQPPVKRQGFPSAIPGNTRERVGDYWLYAGRQLRYTYSVNSF